jgi:hypothetical protein
MGKFLSIVIAVLIIGAQVSGYDRRWQVGAEFLYLSPSLDRTTFALSNNLPTSLFLHGPVGTTTSQAGDSIKNEFQYHPGYSVFGSFKFNECTDFTVQWNYLSCVDSANFTGNYFPTQGDPFVATIYNSPFETTALIWAIGLFEGFCTARRNFKYQNLELTLGQRVLNFNRFDLQLQGGVNFAQIKIREKFNYTSFPTQGPFTLVTLNVNEQSNMLSVGPQIGLDMNYFFFSGFYLTGAANSSLLVSKLSKKSNSVLFFTPGEFFNTAGFKDAKHWKLVPEVDIQFGLGYERCLFGLLCNVEIGFEALEFFNAQQNYHFNDFNFAESDTLSNVGLYGLYVSGSVCF